MSEIDGDDMVSSSCLSEVQAIQNEQLTEVYSKFNFKKTKSEPMTIDSYRDNVSISSFFLFQQWRAIEFI